MTLPRTYAVCCTGVLLTDGLGRSVEDLLWADLLPEVQIVDSFPKEGKYVLQSITNPVWVHKLIVGTRGACLHWGHCDHPEIQGQHE